MVRQFQRDRGLAVDGIVGPQTLAALQADALANQVYIVKKGDTLSHIAKAYSVSLDELIQANDLASTVIYPGQTLVIPAAAAAMETQEYVVRSGENLSVIAQKFGLSAADFWQISMKSTIPTASSRRSLTIPCRQ